MSDARSDNEKFRDAIAPLVDRMREFVNAVRGAGDRHGNQATATSPAMRGGSCSGCLRPGAPIQRRHDVESQRRRAISCSPKPELRQRLADALGVENAGSLLDTPGPEAV